MEVTGDFDAVVAAMDTALVVVTVAAEDDRDGCLVGFHSQASIEPRRYVVWLSVANRTWRLAERSEQVAVHVLARGQHDLAEHFGGQTGDDVDKLADIPWDPGPGGVPLLVACPHRFVGRVIERLGTDGDHVGMVLEPIEVSGEGPRQPLRLHHADDIEPGHPA